MDNAVTNALKGWLPYKVVQEKAETLFRWLYVGDQPFTDPFFDETISICKTHTENLKPYKCVSGIHMLTEWADATDNIAPNAFIFHVSRCGSTLVSQALATNDENISLSEVPIFDEILRMPYNQQQDAQTVKSILAAAIKWYGNKRNGNEARLFIKTDSWHLLFYKQLRALYPTTPFIIMYRQPEEVLFSQQRQKGMHAVMGLIEPTIFGFDKAALESVHPNNYMSIVLEKYFQNIIEIANTDKNVLLVNYNEGITTIMEKIAGFVEMEMKDIDKEMLTKRSRYHAKNGAEIFKEKYPEQPVTSPNIAMLQNLYAQMETLRLQKALGK